MDSWAGPTAWHCLDCKFPFGRPAQSLFSFLFVSSVFSGIQPSSTGSKSPCWYPSHCLRDSLCSFFMGRQILVPRLLPRSYWVWCLFKTVIGKRGNRLHCWHCHELFFFSFGETLCLNWLILFLVDILCVGPCLFCCVLLIWFCRVSTGTSHVWFEIKFRMREKSHEARSEQSTMGLYLHQQHNVWNTNLLSERFLWLGRVAAAALLTLSSVWKTNNRKFLDCIMSSAGLWNGSWLRGSQLIGNVARRKQWGGYFGFWKTVRHVAIASLCWWCSVTDRRLDKMIFHLFRPTPFGRSFSLIYSYSRLITTLTHLSSRVFSYSSALVTWLPHNSALLVTCLFSLTAQTITPIRCWEPEAKCCR